MFNFSLRHEIRGLDIIPLLIYRVIISIVGIGANCEHDLMKIIVWK